jgi:hypothetical protein
MTDPRPGNPLQRLPLPALFVVIVVIWAGGRLVFAHGTIDATRVVLDVIGGVLIAAIATVGVGRRRRRLGGIDASLQYLRAVRTGDAPADADTTGWSTELDRSEARIRRQRWFIRVAGLLPFGLGVWAATMADSRVIGILLAVAMVAGWIFTEVSTPRAIARMERLRQTAR